MTQQCDAHVFQGKACCVTSLCFEKLYHLWINYWREAPGCSRNRSVTFIKKNVGHKSFPFLLYLVIVLPWWFYSLRDCTLCWLFSLGDCRAQWVIHSWWWYYFGECTPLVIVLNTLSWWLFSLFSVLLYTHFFMSSLCVSTPSVIVPLADWILLATVLSIGDCTHLVIVLPWLLYSLGDFVVAHLELGEQDGAVLGPPAVNHGDDLDPPAQGPQVPQVLYWTLHGLKQQQRWFL